MPIPTTSRLPIPKDESEFESITAYVLRVIYPNRDFQKYGCRGQVKYGIDVKTVDGGAI